MTDVAREAKREQFATKAEYQALTKGILPCAGCGKPKSACGCS